METSNMSDSRINGTLLSEMLDAASKIEGVDIELALSRISGKQDVLEDCIEQTAYSIDEKLKKMSRDLSTGDLRGFSIEAHGLKVALAGVGATRYSLLAYELELASKGGDALRSKKEFIEFAGLMKSLASKLKAVIPQGSAEGKSTGEVEILFQVAKEAADYLSNFEMDEALSCMSRLDPFTFGDEMDALLEYVKNKAKAYKYDEAAFLLKSIISSK